MALERVLETLVMGSRVRRCIQHQGKRNKKKGSMIFFPMKNGLEKDRLVGISNLACGRHSPEEHEQAIVEVLEVVVPVVL